MALEPFKSFGTDAIHAGQPPDQATGAVMTPISLATTFYQRSPGNHSGFVYSRSANPTRKAFEECVAKLEDGTHGLAFASGCAATASLLHLLTTGDEVIAHIDMYGGTHRFFHRVAAPYAGIKFTLIDLRDPANLESAISENTKMIWIETPTNPVLTMLDVKRICSIAHAQSHSVLVVADNTFMSPFFQRPLQLGADVAMHSVSKYINGHSDVIMGAVAMRDADLYQRLKFIQNGVGAVPSPFDAYMAMRGVKTLHVRMERHASNALAVAQYLEKHDKVKRVHYPGLESHPQYALGREQMSGSGGMVTMWLKGGIDESRVFLESLKVWLLAESLGGVESLIEHPAIMTHASVPPDQRAALGIDDSLIRMSTGIEDISDLVDDLAQALDKVPS